MCLMVTAKRRLWGTHPVVGHPVGVLLCFALAHRQQICLTWKTKIAPTAIQFLSCTIRHAKGHLGIYTLDMSMTGAVYRQQ